MTGSDVVNNSNPASVVIETENTAITFLTMIFLIFVCKVKGYL